MLKKNKGRAPANKEVVSEPTSTTEVTAEAKDNALPPDS
jgi:hypothetical protein